MNHLATHARTILCIGNAVRDLVFHVKEIPVRGTKTNASQYHVLTGGNAVNAAIAITHLGGHAIFSGPIGDKNDSTAQDILDDLARTGISDAGAVRVSGAKTALSAILLDEDGERTITTYREGALSQARISNPDEIVAQCDAIVLDNRYADFAMDLCVPARALNKLVILDGDRSMPLKNGLLDVATHAIFSADGLRKTMQMDDLNEALIALARHTRTFVGVTRGPEGLDWIDQTGALRHMSAFRIKAVDTLGAGDVFHGAFALFLAEGMDEVEALRLASASAAIKCTRFGGAFGAPARDEVLHFVKSQTI